MESHCISSRYNLVSDHLDSPLSDRRTQFSHESLLWIFSTHSHHLISNRDLRRGGGEGVSSGGGQDGGKRGDVHRQEGTGKNFYLIEIPFKIDEEPEVSDLEISVWNTWPSSIFYHKLKYPIFSVYHNCHFITFSRTKSIIFSLSIPILIICIYISR